MRIAKMLASGDLQLVILALLGEKPRYGYEIIKALEEHSSGFYAPSPGMVYPALTYLEEMGYTTSETEGNKKLYKITEAGSEYLKKNRATADETLEQLARIGKRIEQYRRRFEEDEDEQADQPSESEARSEWRQTRAEFRESHHEMRGALRDKLGAASEERKRIVAILRRAIDEIRGKQPN